MSITSKRGFILSALAAAVTLGAGGLASAHEWPNRPITMLVPQPAGSIQDLVARALGEELAQILKQPVVVDNRPSASQVIASSLLARATPDGHTLMVSVMPNVIAPHLLKGQNFSGNQDFAVVSHSLSSAGFLAVSPQLKVNNLKEFIALLKANPGKYMFGSAGVGTPMHMFLEQFNRDANIQSVHVPYKSFPPIIPDISNNVVQYTILPLGQLQMVKSGKMKGLGFAGAKRDPDHPNMPTLDEQGLKGFDATLQYFVIGPKGMPPDVVTKLNAAINTVQAKESYQAKYKTLGGTTVPQNVSPAAATARLRHEDERFLPLVKAGKITLE
ncbi:Bug family tripartite tricarboxylate transporter substrate binding protein [Cupriavidus oxalaticus]|uniref:Tripartite tricarboxylate transporter substrate binding protein n=1 Tax=Cupriavidus oxalaticus TaxID=96344 RepID=A0A4P7LKZ1_9BURK|nr:tripartite tricarboxylate transporter substrate binding protein [Cupriavidus oxalaticus]QBY56228.1 tripartite tricarboxylate transporter substrate binding protein [Cupriavidus oxalaticus]